MSDLQCLPSEFPSFETCLRLKNLGLLPPLGEKHTFAYNEQGLLFIGKFVHSTSGHSRLAFISDSENYDYYEKENFVFCPTLDQLHQIIFQEIEKAKLFLDWTCFEGIFYFCTAAETPSLYGLNVEYANIEISSLGNSNPAEAAALALIFLIENKFI